MNNGNQIKLEFWDCSGKEKYKRIVPIYLKFSDCVILGYDITKMESFDNIRSFWYPLAKGNSDTDLIYLLAYKNDIYEERQVDDERGENYS